MRLFEKLSVKTFSRIDESELILILRMPPAASLQTSIRDKGMRKRDVPFENDTTTGRLNSSAPVPAESCELGLVSIDAGELNGVV
jgi:hypothetical protein